MNEILRFAAFITAIIDRILVPLVFTIAFLVFIWGVFQYFIAGGTSEEKREEGKKFILYAIIGFFLMISIWGIVNILVHTFGFNSSARPDLPTFNGGSRSGSNVINNSDNSQQGAYFTAGNSNSGSNENNTQASNTCGGLGFQDLCYPWNKCVDGQCVSGDTKPKENCTPGAPGCSNVE